MNILFNLIILLAMLVAVIAIVQNFAARFKFPETTLLALVGILVGVSCTVFIDWYPGSLADSFALILYAGIPAEVYLWIFLPPLLFQAALEIDVRQMMGDVAPILMLAVVAVFVATAVVGLMMWLFSDYGLLAGLLLGAVIATTDPSAVISIFRSVGAPERLIRLVEGESLFNDAAAIAIVGVLVASLMGNSQEATLSAGLISLAIALLGGMLFGALSGRCVAFLLDFFAKSDKAQISLTLAIVYPIYLIGNQFLHVSGVVSVVVCGLVINMLGRTRISPLNWKHLQLIWAQIASLAGAIVFLLATLHVPLLLRGENLAMIGLLVLVVIATLLARLMVLFGFLPILTRLKLSAPINHAYKLAITWGGLRGPITLVLALGIAEHSALPESLRHFVAILATGFVLFSLIVPGLSLKQVIHWLQLDRLSGQDSALQQQAIRLSTIEVETSLKQTGEVLHIAPSIVDAVNARYRRDMAIETAAFDLEAALPDNERFKVALVTLASKESDLIPSYGSGVVSVHTLDVMMHNANKMIEAVRQDGRAGYSREARKVLEIHPLIRIAQWLHRHFHLNWPLSKLLTERFELLICRRAVLEELRCYAQERINPLFGERLTRLLISILDARIQNLDQAILAVEAQYGRRAYLLEYRLLRLQALSKSTHYMQTMVNDRLISPQAFNFIQKGLRRAWRDAISRPLLLKHDAVLDEPINIEHPHSPLPSPTKDKKQ